MRTPSLSRRRGFRPMSPERLSRSSFALEGNEHLRAHLMRGLRQLLLVVVAICANAAWSVTSDDKPRAISGDDRVRAALGLSEEALTDAALRESALGLFPLGTSWADAVRKVRQSLVRNSRRATIAPDTVRIGDRRNLAYCDVTESDTRLILCVFGSDPELRSESLSDRTWSIALNFEDTNSLQSVAVNSSVAPCWAARNPSRSCLRKATDDCKSKGGDWYGHVRGRGRNTGCNLPTTDAGKPCVSGEDCEGTCIPVDENGFRCVCDKRKLQPKGAVEFCTENGVVRLHVE
jgi:hypothetical protein